MKRRNPIYIIALVTGIALLACGCAHKKKIQPATTAQQQELERQRIADSIAEAEAKKRAMVQTLNVPRITVSVQMSNGQKITTPATLRWQRGTGATVSVLPLVGMEMFRAEINEERLCLIDKINRRYTTLTLDEIRQIGVPFSLDTVDEWVDNKILARRDEPTITISFNRTNIHATAILHTPSMQTDVNVNLRPTNLGGYQYVSLEQLITGL